MPLAKKIDEKTGLVTITISGEIDLLQTIQSAAAEMVADPDFHPGADSIWDLRKVDTKDMSTDEILHLVEYIKRHKEQRGYGYKVAIVADRDLLFGGARMFAAFSDNEPFTCRVFRDMQEAEHWIAGKC